MAFITSETLIYAGVGARKTPAPVLRLMTDIAIELRQNNWMLRSGGAAGADTAFHVGARTQSRVLGPNNHIPDEAMLIAQEHHPVWERLSPYVRRLMGRNVQILLGAELTLPAKMCICWTPNGEAVGGTGHTLRVAAAYSIPIFNLWHEYDLQKLIEFVRNIQKES